MTKKQEQGNNEGIGRILRWVPLATLTATIILLVGMYVPGGLTRITAWYLLLSLLPGLAFLTLLVIGIYVLVRRRLEIIGRLTLFLALLCLAPVVLNFIPVAFPFSLERTEPAATVRLPADEPLLVAWGGDSIETNYHAAAPDQRWAYDLVVEPYFLETAELEDYGCYGVPVLAPAAGWVVAAHDGEPDETPGVVSNNFTAPTGNYVAIELDETGTYLILAHMKPDSLLVSIGDHVNEGEPLGQCGNSGNTSEPHIHIHHQRQDPNDFPLNFAEGLPLYFRDHDGPAMPQGGIRVEDNQVVAEGDIVQHVGGDGR